VAARDGQTSSESLYEGYTAWCDENDEKPVAVQVFGRELTAAGYAKGRAPGGTRVRRGIRLRDAGDAGDGQVGIFDSTASPEEKYTNQASLPSLPSPELDQDAGEERLAIQEADGITSTLDARAAEMERGA
jgi:hypothetical protein